LYCNDATAITVQCTGKKKKKVKVYSAHCCSNRQANPRKYDSKNFWWHFLFKAGNWARKYHYGPGFQKHPVAKMRFDLEGQIWGSKVKW